MAQQVFDILLVSDSVDRSFDYDGSVVKSLEGSGNNLFVGTSNGGILSFSIQEDRSSGTVSASEWARASLPTKSPVLHMESASALNTLIVLSDGTLYFLTLQDLEINWTGKFKGHVTCFNINQGPTGSDPFVMEVAVGTQRNRIQLCDVTMDHLQITKEIHTEDIPFTLAYDGRCLCYATDVHYYIYDVGRDQQHPLFPINAEEMTPAISRVGKEEFLLTGMQSLGVFATGDGVSNRPPLVWGTEKVTALTYSDPFILALGEQYITVHTAEDQCLKQNLAFSNGVCIGHFDGQIFVTTHRQIYKLTPISWERQVEALLADKRVTEALEVARTAKLTGYSKEGFLQLLKSLQQRAAFMKIEEMNWNEASDLVSESQLDVREIISLYPGLMPSTSGFVRAVPALHSLPNILQVTGKDPEKKLESELFLLDLLELVRQEDWSTLSRVEIDTVLLKLCATLRSESFSDLINDKDAAIQADLYDCKTYLKERHKHHCLACIEALEGRWAVALQLWKRLETKELQDSDYPGLDFFADKLASCDNDRLKVEYLPWILQTDECVGVKLVKTLAKTAENADIYLPLLDSNVTALCAFLETLIYEKESESEPQHTRLALLYLEQILADSSEQAVSSASQRRDSTDSTTKQDDVRQKLRQFLLRSDKYRARFLLGKLQECEETKVEAAFVLGKLDEYEDGLNVLVKQLRNYAAAEEYCAIFCEGKGRKERQAMNSLLLKVYLSIREANDLPVAQIIKLLNKPDIDVDLVEIMSLLPAHWSLSVLSPFVTQSCRKLLANQRNSTLSRELAKTASLLARLRQADAANVTCNLTEQTRCAVCNDFFVDSECFRYPSGILVHRNCVRRERLCPVTQQLFVQTANSLNSA